MKNKNVIRKIFMISDNNNDNNTTVNILYLYLVIIHLSLQTIIIITKFILKNITKLDLNFNYFKRRNKINTIYNFFYYNLKLNFLS